MEVKRIKVLVADRDSNVVRECKTNLEPYGFEVIEGKEDAHQLPGQIRLELPDVVLLSVILQGSDALEVMDKLQLNPPGKRPLFLILSPYDSGFFAREAVEKGACGWFEFPLDFEMMAYRIKQLYERTFGPLDLHVVQPETTREMYVTDVLLSMGVPAQNKGFGCLRVGIEMAIDDPKVMDQVTTELYPAIGRYFGSTPAQVEKAIRHAIDTVWDIGNAKMLAKYFNYSSKNPRRRPVNSEFIAVMATRIRMEMKRKKVGS